MMSEGEARCDDRVSPSRAENRERPAQKPSVLVEIRGLETPYVPQNVW